MEEKGQERGNAFPKIGIKTQDLIDDVEALLKKAIRARNKFDFGAVNWGDLSVRDIEYRFSMLHPEDGPFGVVMIEEASPDCKLGQWIYEQLDKEKYSKVYIECEW